MSLGWPWLDHGRFASEAGRDAAELDLVLRGFARDGECRAARSALLHLVWDTAAQEVHAAAEERRAVRHLADELLRREDVQETFKCREPPAPEWRRDEPRDRARRTDMEARERAAYKQVEHLPAYEAANALGVSRTTYFRRRKELFGEDAVRTLDEYPVSRRGAPVVTRAALVEAMTQRHGVIAHVARDLSVGPQVVKAALEHFGLPRPPAAPSKALSGWPGRPW